MTQRIEIGGLQIAAALHQLVETEIAPGTGVDSADFWRALEDIIRDFGPRNAALLEKRDQLQAQIDAWHVARRGQPHDAAAYRSFLEQIGYLVAPGEDFSIDTENVDAEIAELAGPQLVVPVDNARYALNAANARWGSLYNALYGTDVVSEEDGCKRSSKYNAVRGNKVIARAREFLDEIAPLQSGSHRYATRYKVVDGRLVVRMGDGSESGLWLPEHFTGYRGEPARPDCVLLCNNGLHVELHFGEGYYIGRKDIANIYDIQLESALSTIMDCEDSVASVDAADKVRCYRNWTGLMKGTLTRKLEKDGQTIERALEPDRLYTAPDGQGSVRLHGRSMMFVRNVGMHLHSDAVLLDGQPVAETLLDAMVTSLAAIHDLKGEGELRNSRAGSVYIVKPKMHGPEEVAMNDELFARVEDALGLTRHTLKMGIMDEERRTSANLKACIRAARHRVVFINTGFLDRTGDEIHTSMEAGPMLPKGEMKNATWLGAYENANVDVGLACGLKGRAQIGKGMWAMPDEMAAMLEAKVGHLMAGASCAWVPSPTAATLHALHYHRVNVAARQDEIARREAASLDALLSLPLLPADRELTPEEIHYELENNAQGILGYVARWVGQGVGCSKVPDIKNVGLMEDCATLRISSQLLANWLHHGLCDEVQVRETMARMAVIVDRQNASDPDYQPMSPAFDDSIPYLAALDLVLKGREQANGYTEFVLYARRQQMKAAQAG